MLHKGEIELDPPYQRGQCNEIKHPQATHVGDTELPEGEVWPPIRQSQLIDSIYGGIVLPPLVFSVQSDGTRCCVDGKQRLTSIRKFMEGFVSRNFVGTEED